MTALGLDDLVRVHRVLLACAEFSLWSRWLQAQAPEVVQAIRDHERQTAEQGRREALAIAGARPPAASR